MFTCLNGLFVTIPWCQKYKYLWKHDFREILFDLFRYRAIIGFKCLEAFRYLIYHYRKFECNSIAVNLFSFRSINFPRSQTQSFVQKFDFFWASALCFAITMIITVIIIIELAVFNFKCILINFKQKMMVDDGR